MTRGRQDLADLHYNLRLPCRGYPMEIQCKILEMTNCPYIPEDIRIESVIRAIYEKRLGDDSISRQVLRRRSVTDPERN